MLHQWCLFTVEHFWNFQEGKNGFFDAAGKSSSPSYSSGNRRLIFCQLRMVLLCFKDFTYAIHLEQEQNMFAEGLSKIKTKKLSNTYTKWTSHAPFFFPFCTVTK